MAEDEMSRAAATGFGRVFPPLDTTTSTSSSPRHLLSLFKSPRFSDHLLAQWTATRGSYGCNKHHIPPRYRPVAGTEAK